MSDKVLSLKFRCESGMPASIVVSQPREGLDAAAIRAQADIIVESGIFESVGSKYAAYTGAQLVETIRTDFII